MKRVAALIAAGMLVGCESAVLVNNRPPLGADADVQQPDQVETAGATVSDEDAQPAGSTIEPMENDDADATDASDASDTTGDTTANDQAADQTVETSNVRIESKSN